MILNILSIASTDIVPHYDIFDSADLKGVNIGEEVGEVHVSEMKGKLLVVYHNLADEKGYAMVGKVELASYTVTHLFCKTCKSH